MRFHTSRTFKVEGEPLDSSLRSKILFHGVFAIAFVGMQILPYVFKIPEIYTYRHWISTGFGAFYLLAWIKVWEGDRSLHLAAVTIDQEGIWYSRELKEDGFVSWKSLDRTKYRLFFRRLDLRDKDGRTLIRVEKELGGFDVLKELVARKIESPDVEQFLWLTRYDLYEEKNAAEVSRPRLPGDKVDPHDQFPVTLEKGLDYHLFWLGICVCGILLAVGVNSIRERDTVQFWVLGAVLLILSFGSLFCAGYYIAHPFRLIGDSKGLSVRYPFRNTFISKKEIINAFDDPESLGILIFTTNREGEYLLEGFNKKIMLALVRRIARTPHPPITGFFIKSWGHGIRMNNDPHVSTPCEVGKRIPGDPVSE